MEQVELKFLKLADISTKINFIRSNYIPQNPVQPLSIPLGYPNLKTYRASKFYADFDFRTTSEILTYLQTLSKETSQEIQDNLKKVALQDLENQETPLKNEVFKFDESNLSILEKPENRNQHILLKIFMDGCPYCEEIEYDWKLLALEAKTEFLDSEGVEKVAIAEINGDEIALPDYISVEFFPTIVFIPKFSNQASYHTGDRNVNEWLNFIDDSLHAVESNRDEL